MPYSNDSDLLKEYSNAELARLTGDSSGVTVDLVRTAYARSAADSLIDAFLYGSYITPLVSPIDELIKAISISLTISNLYDYANKKSSVPPTIVNRRNRALEQLSKVSKFEIALSYATRSSPSASIVSNRKDKSRIFDESQLNNFFSGD